jgi:hypothetical protein
LVKGERGVIQFVLFTGWLPAPEEFQENVNPPLPADIGYHSPMPMYEGQNPMSGKCDVLGGVCYYDGSSLNARQPFLVLCNSGGEALWKYLEDTYRSKFEEGNYPKVESYPHRLRSDSNALRKLGIK